MSLPEPEVGLVIRYSYLWLSEHRRGQEEGAKDRPCAIVLRTEVADGDTRVTVLPITHSAPQDPKLAIEIPQVVKQRLGLDWERSWIILGESNEFIWPAPDLRPQPGRDLTSIAYGFLPPGLFDVVLKRFVALARSGFAARVPRTE